MVFSEMNCCSKGGIHEHSPNSHIHIQIFHRIARLSSIDFPDHGEDGFRKMECVWRYLEVMSPCRFCITLTFSLSTEAPAPCAMVCSQAALFWAMSFPVWYQISASGLSESSESSSSWCDGFLRCFSVNPPRYASFSRTWEVDAASNEFWLILILLSGFPEAIGIPRLLDATGLDADAALVAVEEGRFIAAGRDLDTTLSSSFLLLCPLRQCGAAYQAEILSAAKRAEMATNEEDCSTDHAWNFLWSTCLRVDVWCQCDEFGSWGPN